MGSSLVSSNCCSSRAYSDKGKVKFMARKWVDVTGRNKNSVASLKKVSEKDPSVKEEVFKLLHWNTLADRLAHDTFSKVPKEYLSWDYRF